MKAWWGTQDLPTGQACRWTIGPLELWIESRASEWRVATRDTPEALDRFAIEGPSTDVQPPDDAELTRIAASGLNQPITLSPVPADRPIVVRPDAGLWLPPGQAVTFFVSTPTWVEIGTPRGPLVTLPSTRLSDTWFGASKMEGELCYASRTAARLFLEALPRRPGRVRTQIEVRNQGPDRMPLERVQLPAPHLSIFAASDDMLWTPSVTVVRKGQEPRAEVTIASRPPSVAGVTQPLRPARVPGLPNIVVRALGALLSGD